MAHSRLASTAILAFLTATGLATGQALAIEAAPSTFVGTAAECGGTAGSNIVTATWLQGMGLPDNGADAAATPGASSRRGLLLNKNGPTANCSAAIASITGLPLNPTLTELGFDFRIGGHCGGGAPRFNVTSTAGNTYFVGCSAGTHTPAPQDPQWERVRFTSADFFPANPSAPNFVLGTTQVQSIRIIYDEGTDQTSPSDPTGVGLAVLDNIDINGQLIRSGKQ